MPKSLETLIETLISGSRWLLAPIYLGLILAVFLLVVKFFQKLLVLTGTFLAMESSELVVNLLNLLDIVLVTNLVLLVMFSGYENFVSRLDSFVGGESNHPTWLARMKFSDIKILLIGAIVAISTIELLKVLLDLGNRSNEEIVLRVIVHLTFAISGVFFALTEWLKHAHRYKNGDDGH